MFGPIDHPLPPRGVHRCLDEISALAGWVAAAIVRAVAAGVALAVIVASAAAISLASPAALIFAVGSSARALVVGPVAGTVLGVSCWVIDTATHHRFDRRHVAASAVVVAGVAVLVAVAVGLL